ncbi:hypothetical protein GCM10020221_25100 [Streptomyces thioluteus]|uniref:Uncharacterized protein n=1 Tax=Streptomyces thioluteus TaxID=66431 RepID=A0ABP6JBN1_STRTU
MPVTLATPTLLRLRPGARRLDPHGNTAYRAGRAIQAGRVWTNCYHQ